MSSPPHVILNALAPEAARAALGRCCGAARWIDGMMARRPFASEAELEAAADAVWAALDREDLLEAFAHHPAIGTTGTVSAWSKAEQAGVTGAAAETLASLRALNDLYAQRFGHVFLVCATGQSADEMLARLRARIDNAPTHELAVAAAEQAKITRLRLRKLAEGAAP